MTTTSQTAGTHPNPTSRVLDLELLALDLGSCTRCVGSAANVEAAIDLLRPILAATGTSVRFRRTVVETEEQARRHRFVSSPTIRVGGRDIVFDTLESRCDACTELCGCAEGTSCRVWVYQGVEHTEAPVGLIVEALVREIAGAAPAAARETAGGEVPENLRRFFAGRTARESERVAACCGPAEQATCCAPAEKGSCCEAAEPATCGCR